MRFVAERTVELSLSEPAALCLFMESELLVQQSEREHGDCAITAARRELHQALVRLFGVDDWTKIPMPGARGRDG